jgi:hypothetical protein
MARKQTAVTRARERALLADPGEVAGFAWDNLDLLIGEAMIRGAASLADLGAFTGAPMDNIKYRLLDPVRCAWLAAKVEQVVGQRLGAIYGALYHRAVSTGDPNAARLLLQQFGKLSAEPAKRTETLDVKIDLTGLTKDELEKFAKEKARELGLIQPAEYTVKEVAKEAPPNE